MKKILLSAAVLLFCLSASLPALQIKAGYFGETVFHPGVQIGFESPIYDGEILELFWGGELGGYHHIRNHSAIIADAEAGLRFNTPFGLFFELSAGAGGLLRVPAGTVYTETASGPAGKTVITPALIIPAGFAAGWNFNRTDAGITGLYFSMDVFGEYPFNGYMLPHIAAGTGIKIRL